LFLTAAPGDDWMIPGRERARRGKYTDARPERRIAHAELEELGQQEKRPVKPKTASACDVTAPKSSVS
jgi:hypothetical protein